MDVLLRRLAQISKSKSIQVKELLRSRQFQKQATRELTTPGTSRPQVEHWRTYPRNTGQL
jgi:hypothetical protein